MKKINFIAVAFTAILSQSVNANNAKEAIGANIGSEDNAVRIIEEARPEAAPRGIFVLTDKARPEAAPRGIFVLTDKARPEAAPRGIFVLTDKARPEAAPRGARPEMAPRGARPEAAPRGARPEMAPRNAEIGKGFRNTYGVAMHQEKVVIFKSIFTKNDKGIKRGAETAFWPNDSKKIYRNMLPEENGRREQIYMDCSFGF